MAVQVIQASEYTPNQERVVTMSDLEIALRELLDACRKVSPPISFEIHSVANNMWRVILKDQSNNICWSLRCRSLLSVIAIATEYAHDTAF